MSRFDIFRNPHPAAARLRPYLVVLQSDFLREIETVVVAPLAALDGKKAIGRLTPIVEADGKKYHLMINEMGAVPQTLLKRHAGSALRQRDEIVAAIDFLFSGF